MVIKSVKFLSHAKVIDLKERSSISQFVWREKCCLNKNRLGTVGIACIDLWPGFGCWNCICFQAELNHQVIWSHGVPDFGTSPLSMAQVERGTSSKYPMTPSHIHSTQLASLCHSWGTIGQAHIPTKKTSQNSWKKYEICVASKHDNNLTKHMGSSRSCLEQPLEVDKNFTQILVKSRWLVHIPNHVG